jgi:hypothetical protein
VSAAARLALLALATALAGAGGAVAKAPGDVRPVGVGTRIPDAEVRTVEGTPVRLDALTGDGVVALVFYRGGW